MTVTKKDALRITRRLHVQNGDIVLIKSGTALAEMENLNRFVESLEETGKKDILVLVVDDMEDVKTIPAKEMAKLGWYRLHASARPKYLKEQKQDETPVGGPDESPDAPDAQ